MQTKYGNVSNKFIKQKQITCDIYSKTGQDTVLLYKIDWQETMRPFSKLNKFKHLQKFKHQ